MKYLVIAGTKPFTVEARTGTDALLDVKEMIRTSTGNDEIGPSLRAAMEEDRLNFIVIRYDESGQREAVVCGELRGDVQSPVSRELVDVFKSHIPGNFLDYDGNLLPGRSFADKCSFFDFVSTL